MDRDTLHKDWMTGMVIDRMILVGQYSGERSLRREEDNPGIVVVIRMYYQKEKQTAALAHLESMVVLVIAVQTAALQVPAMFVELEIVEVEPGV